MDVKAHDLPSPNAYARIEPNGSVTLSRRYTVTTTDPTLEYKLKNQGYIGGFKINIASCEYFTHICKCANGSIIERISDRGLEERRPDL